MDQYQNFILTGDKILVDDWLSKLDSAYAAGNAGISDELYDQLVRLYEGRFGKRTVIGASPVINKVDLPIAMMSLDKIMKEKELQNFMTKNPGPYVIMDKINGNAGLYEIKYNNKTPIIKLYNRGDGTTGSDLSHILPYLNLPVLPFDVHVKGELVIDKKDYEPYKQDYKTNLSMVNGLLNSQSADPNRLKLFRFIAYDMSFPKNQNIQLKMSHTLEYLKQYGFTIPYAMIAPTLTIEWLSKIFKQQKQNAPYDVDGIVIVADRPVEYSERLIRDNPKYAVAFKEYGQTHEATVTEVVWEASKHGVIKPVVKVNPVPVGNGFTIRRLTGFNAKWISDNQVGPGTTLLVTHNTIPYIMGVLKSTYAQMPPVETYPVGSWKWNDTGVDIVLLEDNDEVKIAKIYEFFKQIGAKYWGETTLAKFYKAGFNTIKKMLQGTREQFISANIEGIGPGTIDRMIKTRDEALPGTSLARLMSASGSFGLGFGVRKITPILDAYPNILEMDPTVKQISQLNGFAEKTAERFVEGLPKFRAFVADIPILQRLIKGELRPPQRPSVTQSAPVIIQHTSTVSSPDQSLAGKSIVFTGFRDRGLEDQIRLRGGAVKTSVSKKTDYVIVGGEKGQGSGKEKKAIQYGIPVLNLEEFRKMFGL
jgi:DNA ligase (NAD+)